MVIYNTYRISLANKAKEEQTLSLFNNETDLINVINEFLNHILENIFSYSDNQGKKRTFTLASLPTVSQENRTISGYFDSAFSGERLKIKEEITNELNYSVNKRELQSRDFFYLIYIPKNSKYGYVVIQKKTNHGVKTVFLNQLNQFLKKKGYMDYHIDLSPASSYNYLMRMFREGELREIKLIKNEIGNSSTEQLGNTLTTLYSGKSEKVIKLDKNQNTEFLKQTLSSLFHENIDLDSKVNISGIQEEFDEVSFRILLNGATKTFYVKNRHKIRSNVDVTNEIEFVHGEATRTSLYTTAMTLIYTIMNIHNDDEAAA